MHTNSRVDFINKIVGYVCQHYAFDYELQIEVVFHVTEDSEGGNT
jgi:hypothetical protein